MHGTHLEAGPARVLVTVAALAALLAPLLFASGCGSSAAINQYTTFANQILSSLNAQEGELKKYWTLPLVQQDGLNKSIAELRKTIADAQAKMDSTDRPQECAALDETLGRAVDQSRELADITTQLGDYLGALAPMAKQADEIVTGLNKLQDSQDVRSSVSGYLSKARSLESSTRTLNPAAQYRQINDLFVGFVADGQRQALQGRAYDCPRPAGREDRRRAGGPRCPDRARAKGPGGQRRLRYRSYNRRLGAVQRGGRRSHRRGQAGVRPEVEDGGGRGAYRAGNLPDPEPGEAVQVVPGRAQALLRPAYGRPS
jgi:hypothetical protein